MCVVSLLVTNLAGRRYLGSLRQDVAETVGGAGDVPRGACRLCP